LKFSDIVFVLGYELKYRKDTIKKLRLQSISPVYMWQKEIKQRRNIYDFSVGGW